MIFDCSEEYPSQDCLELCMYNIMYPSTMKKYVLISDHPLKRSYIYVYNNISTDYMQSI